MRGSGASAPATISAAAIAARAAGRDDADGPPRPGGVAIATIVSSVERAAILAPGPHARDRDDDGLQERVADALEDIVWVFGDGQVHDAARVGLSGPISCWPPGVLRLLHRERAICRSSASLPLR